MGEGFFVPLRRNDVPEANYGSIGYLTSAEEGGLMRTCTFTLVLGCMVAGLGCSGGADTPPADLAPGANNEPAGTQIYCGGGTLPIDFEALPEERVFCLDTPVEVDYFVTYYGDYGDYSTIYISSLRSGDLEPLRDVRFDSIKHLTIDRNTLEDLSGLEGVSEVDLLEIEGNSQLKSLKGLDNLTSIQNRGRIFSNPSLISLEGLERLAYIKTLSIVENDALQRVDLPALERTGDGTSATDGLGISRNATLKEVTGFDKFTSTFNVAVSYNPMLERVDAFHSLETVTGAVQMGRNDALVEIDAFSRVAPNAERCMIVENPMLSGCIAQTICEQVSAPNAEVLTYGNKSSGCP